MQPLRQPSPYLRQQQSDTSQMLHNGQTEVFPTSTVLTLFPRQSLAQAGG